MMSHRATRAAIAMASVLSLISLVPATSHPIISHKSPRALTFVQRVEAQRSIERVYYAHQLDANLSFEAAIPPDEIEKKVRAYLKRSAALERFWGVRVTSEMLQAEVDRIVRGTRMPDRLRELFSALNGDPLLIQECLARPVLVERMARNLFAADGRIHADAQRQAVELRGSLADGHVKLTDSDP